MSLPTDSSASAIVSQVQSIASASGLLVQSINLQTQALKPSKLDKDVIALGSVEINLRLIGSYESLKNFLSLIATNVRVMDVADLHSEASNKNNLNALTHNIIINAYYQAE
jgi:Tfp pilus assembly protein PilO